MNVGFRGICYHDRMAYTPTILAFAGATRTGSYNKRLIKVAAKAAEQAGASVTLIDLRDMDLPLYDGDLEKAHGLPENAKKLKAMLLEHDGLLISSPEYNSSISAVLKNAIDWASRPVEGQPPLAEFRGKVAGLMAASPGALGGLRGLVHLRAILGNIGVLVLPDQLAVSKAHEAFDDEGSLKDEVQHKKIAAIAERTVQTIAKLNA